MDIKQIKSGAILSYLLIFVNTLYGIVFIPFLVSRLGDGEYGVYKIIGSLIGSITVLDLGIGGTVLRYIAKFNAEKDEKNLSNFSAMALIQATVLSAIMIFVCGIIYFYIDDFYASSLSVVELKKAKQLFVLFVGILVLNTYEKVFFNIIAGCGIYRVANSLKLLRILLKVLFSWLAISKFPNSIMLLIVDIVLLILIMLVQFIYISKVIKIKIKFIRWDNILFKDSMKYTIIIFFHSIAVQFNGNLDNMVIGSVIGASAVTVYSIGLQLYGMFEQFAVAFSDLMLPSVSKQIAEGDTLESLENTVIKVGRFEFIALGGAFGAFIIIGKEFINLWLGSGYSWAWDVAVILMFPTIFPLVQNVCISILRAKNKMGFRTVVVCLMAVFNLLITVLGVKHFGVFAACVGTAISLVLANIIVMNIYYIKVIKLNIFRIFRQIFSKIIICIIISTFALWGIDNYIFGSWIDWVIKAGIYILVYGILLLIYGLNENEKKVIFGRFSNAGRKR